MWNYFSRKVRLAAIISLVLDHPSSSSGLLTSSISKSTTATTKLFSTLNKRSSALDVLQTLNREKSLAPYVSNGGTAVVTGGNSGIGVVSVQTLALAGMNVILCARDVDAAERVRAAVDDDAARARVRVQKLDLADLSSVRAAARDIIAAVDGRVDVLLNNAGVMATPERRATVQGFELQFGTNHVGHHMLTRLLMPYMNRECGRVVTVASTAHSMGELDLENLNYGTDRSYTPWGAYGQSKLANILFAKGLQDRLMKGNGTGNIASVSLHPGVIATNLWQYSIPRILRPLGKIFAPKTVEQGAATNVFCSLVDPSSINGGDYFSDCQPETPTKNGQDLDGKLRNALWDETEKMIKDAGFELPDEL